MGDRLDGWARGASARRTRRDLLRFAGIGGAAAAVAACTPTPSAPGRCPEGQTTCGGNCVDLQTNVGHCGLCGTDCGTGHTCVSGICVVTCVGAQTNCGGTCTDTTTDPLNCGACGHGCGSGSTCSGGVCSCTSPGFGLCAGNCIDLTTTSDCGGCGVDCPSGPHSTAICASGHCSVVCDPGYLNCNSSPFDGCEIDIMNDNNNCGGCGLVCTGGHICSAGVCTGCVGRSDCAPGQICQGGVCGPCVSAADCGSSELCVAGACT